MRGEGSGVELLVGRGEAGRAFVGEVRERALGRELGNWVDFPLDRARSGG